MTTTQNNNAIAPLEQVRQGLEKFKGKLEEALPKGMSIDKFNRTAMQGIQTHKDQNKLLSAERKTLYLAIQKAAGDGLQLDGREAALVVFGNEVVYMPMVQGLVRLARNSGEIKSIISEVVYENDKFVYRIGMDEMPLHEPDWFGDRGEAKGVWACVKLVNGEVISAMLPKAKVMKIASKSKNAAQYDPDKGAYFDEWWKKTAIKNVLKYAPKSTELEMTLAKQEAQEFGEEDDLENLKVVGGTDADKPAAEEKPKPRKKRTTKAADAVKADKVEEQEAITDEPPATLPHDDDGVIIDADYSEVDVEVEDDDGVPV